MDLKKTITKSLKVILWTVGAILVLFLLLVLLIQIPAIQNKIKDKAVTYLEGKIHTKVTIDHIELGLPKSIILEKVYFESQQKDTLLYGEKLAVDISLFKLIDNKIEINFIDLKGITANIKKNENGIFNFDYIVKAFASKEKSKSDSKPMTLSIAKVNLDKINFKYNDIAGGINTAYKLQKLNADINEIDLDKEQIDIETLNVNSLSGFLNIEKTKKNPKKKSETKTTDSKNWKVKLNKTDLKNIAFKFDDQNYTPIKKGIDYRHLDLNNFNLIGEKLNYTSQNLISGNIKELKIQEKSGLNVQSLKTEFYYTDKTTSLKKLYLKTPQTLLKNEIVVSYPSLDSLPKNPGELNINASLIGSEVGFKDVLIFVPDLKNTNTFKSNPSAIMKINSTVSGKLNNIQIPNLELSGIGTTKIDASGRITGLPDAKNAFFDLDIKNLESSSKDIYQFVPAGTIPNTIQLPSQLAVKGNFKGTIDDFYTNINLASSYGTAKVKGNFNQKRKNQENYKADAEFKNFDIGALIKNKDLGKITLNTKIIGNGLNPKTANATVSGKITSAQYNKYTYHNANLNGAIKNGKFNATMVAKDPNLAFNLTTDGSFKDKYPAVKLKMNIDIADLEKLNLHAGPLKLKGQVDADITTADLDYLNGNIDLHHFRMANDKEEFALDSISVIATATPNKNTIDLKSQFLEANLTGKYQLTQLADAITNSISKYYDVNPLSKKVKTNPQQLAFTVSVKDHPILFQLLPGLKSLEPISIKGRYNSVNDSIVLNGTIPKLIYDDNTISNAVIKVDTKEKALVYSLIVDDIQNAQFQLPYTSLSGKVENNITDYSLQLKDLNNKERYVLAGTLKAVNGATELRLNDKLVLNYDAWNIDAKNLIRFGNNGIYANAVALSKDGNAIKIQSESEQPNAPLKVDFKDFKIETITNMIQKKDLVMGGKINGNTVIKNINTSPVFTADMEISDFTFNKDSIGNINIKVNNEIANTYKANIVITGQGNQVNLDGNYKSDSGSFDMDLDMEKLNLKSIQGFSMGNISKGNGFFSGKFKIKGTTKEPKVIGDLQFNEIAFNVKQLNSYFKSMNDKVAVNEKGIDFNNFTIKDEENNILVIDGNMATTNFMDYGFHLDVKADNFKAVNSTAKDNDLYYGKLYLNSRLKVTGDINKPIIDGKIKINKNTKLTVVLPQSDPSIVDREGVVEFIDQDNPEFNKTIVLTDTIAKTKFKGIEALVNIEVDKEAELNLIIDKGNGDYLKLKGEAQLTGGIDPSGNTTLTGRYDFTGGTYEMTFKLIKRKFDIKEGSYILWTGEPTKADINITAVYKTNAAPIDLLDNQLGEITPELRNTYKQKIPFETNLIMKGDLMKPDISFDIVLPEGNNSVSTEIINATQQKLTQLRQQPSELNKQVFALLLLNRFIGENPFASESGGASAESLARQSASKILSQQLTNLAGDLISGVELDFDLESTDNYTTGQLENRTDLNVGLSKKLLNDRLKVTIGSTFGLEGQQQVNQEANTIAGDLSAEYQLSKDGRYRLRAYRKNQYQVALQGQVIETGVAFVITMNYNKFKELFRKAKDRKSKLGQKKADSKKDKK